MHTEMHWRLPLLNWKRDWRILILCNSAVLTLFNDDRMCRSPNDQRLFIIQEHDPEMLSQSFDELQLFSDSSGRLVSVSWNTFVQGCSMHTALTTCLNLPLSCFCSGRCWHLEHCAWPIDHIGEILVWMLRAGTHFIPQESRLFIAVSLN